MIKASAYGIGEQAFKRLGEVGAEADRTLTRADRLCQAILKRAFEGKLVPQDPNDG
ncbi:MAG: hypothetical protein WCC87_11760 [Candidatus Korobacteraceae bacterium]